MPETSSGDELIDHIADQVLRGQGLDIEALIEANPELSAAARDKMRKLVGAFGSGKRAAPEVLTAESKLPFEKLGPYTLISFMGEGGMGRVFLAEHDFLQRRVALKIIRPELAASSVTRQRFQREAMRIAKLRHENIVSVYDAGEVDGVAFLALELVEGSGLDELLRDARRSGERMKVVVAVRHARDIALALQCAHDAGIIHRDVKPSNVRITPDGRALLLDFGLSFEEEAATLSTAGQFHGTPQYASPEQIESKSGVIDTRTDVYSLGITLYECLTGRAPFAGGSVVQLFHQILAGELNEPRESNGEVDAELNGIVMRSVSKHRDDRFGSAGEMAQALDAWLEKRAQVEHATTVELSRVERRARVGVRNGLVAAMVVVVLGSASWFLFRGGGNRQVVASHPEQAVVLSTIRSTTPLFGAANIAFDQLLKGWDSPIGPGTFGADQDSSGVVGTCSEGITTVSYALSHADGRVTGRFTPIVMQPDDHLGTGVGVECANGKVVAWLCVPQGDGHVQQLCELVRAESSSWIRGDVLQTAPLDLALGQPLSIDVSWNETDTTFSCLTPGAALTRQLLLERGLRGTGRPTRFFLVVDTGSARFEELVLEES